MTEDPARDRRHVEETPAERVVSAKEARLLAIARDERIAELFGREAWPGVMNQALLHSRLYAALNIIFDLLEGQVATLTSEELRYVLLWNYVNDGERGESEGPEEVLSTRLWKLGEKLGVAP
jgi:hypothetical protein